MRIVASILLIATVVLAVYTFAGPPPERNEPQKLRLRDLRDYIKITDRPFRMQDSTIASCRPYQEIALNPHEPSHPEVAFCNVYVNELAKDPMISGKGRYPEGSLVIKSKLASAEDKKPLLYTVMQKMAPGYDDNRGNWKYVVVDGTTFRQIAAGRIDSCITCHEGYADTDYITRTYLSESGRTK